MWVPNPQDLRINIFGGKVFKEVIKVKWSHQSVPNPREEMEMRAEHTWDEKGGGGDGGSAGSCPGHATLLHL